MPPKVSRRTVSDFCRVSSDLVVMGGAPERTLPTVDCLLVWRVGTPEIPYVCGRLIMGIPCEQGGGALGQKTREWRTQSAFSRFIIIHDVTLSS